MPINPLSDSTAPPPEAPRRSRTDRAKERLSTRDKLIRAGLVLVLERGWAATSVDAVVASCDVPKGSFYHYFKSKDDFGHAVLGNYQSFFMKRLNRWFGPDTAPLGLNDRFAGFLGDSQAGMERHGYRRGCLIGALGQETAGLDNDFRVELERALTEWDAVLARCLARSGIQGDCMTLANAFWASWEGAVLRAMLSRDAESLRLAVKRFLASL